jgi:A/G-specific adenine glycosylase
VSAPDRAVPAAPPESRDAILAWYAARGRTLPFRDTTDPYAILVSEAMAQQTQAARAGEAWTRFMARFPTVQSLADATPADVLRAWQGLGYNRRAVNLQRAARMIVEEHGGRVPSDLAGLEALPGVGPYTARAVAALAFGMPVGAVDTNVRRVLGRIVAGDAGAMDRATLQHVADASVPPDQPGFWTHALMDIGATLCHPRKPDCGPCPARRWCRYVASGSPAPLPASAVDRRFARETAVPFTATSRWLRGRIVDRLRDAPDGDWVVVDGSIGDHDAAAVDRALLALARDGIILLAPRLAAEDEPSRARLPT